MVRYWLLLFLLVYLPLSCGGDSKGYSAETESNFMQACTLLGDQTGCKCALTELEARYSEKELRQMEASIQRTRQFPTELAQVLAGCASASGAQAVATSTASRSTTPTRASAS